MPSDAQALLYVAAQGHLPGERAAYALDRRAADGTRPPKPAVRRSLPQLRAAWRESAVRAFGACVVYRLAERARAAAAGVWARVRPVVDVALAAVDVVAVVYVMRGACKRRHLLAEARRHLAHTLRGRRAGPGLDEAIVLAAVGGCTCPVGRGWAMTADLRALYPRGTEDQAVLCPPTRTRYERARLASAALTARVRAERRSRRPDSRSLRPAAVPAGPLPRSGLGRGRTRAAGAGPAGRLLEEQETDLAAIEDSQHVIEAAAALLVEGARERAAITARAQPGPGPAPAHTPQPGTRPPGAGTPTGGIA